MTTVTLCCGQPILVAGIESALAGSSVSLAANCPTLDFLMEEAQKERPDVVLVELSPSITLATLAKLVSSLPLTPVVLWVEAISTEFASQALAVGIRGILRRNLPLDLQINCIERVAAGDLWVEQALCEELLSSRRVALTGRERQVITLLAQGLKNKEIAFELKITEGTVKVYLSRLFQKVGVRDRFELALFALKNFHCSQDFEPSAENPKHAGRSGPPVDLQSLVTGRPSAIVN